MTEAINLWNRIGTTSPQLFGAVGDGIINDRTAFYNANAAGGTIVIPTGTYRISSALTITSKVRFENGAIIKPDNGIQVTFAAGYEAGPHQHVFDISNGGTCWSLTPCDATQYHWGAVGNGAADDTAAVQACIDNAYYYDNARVCRLARGSHLITKLILGWGSTTSYGSINFCGAKDPYVGTQISFGGTVLVTTSWENAIEVRSARRVVISDITIVGPWKSHIETNNLGHSAASLDSSDVTNWYPSGMPASAVTQYKFSTGIHIDPRCGTAPGTKYSDVTYPSYATPTGSAQYGLAPSSQILIERCTITGFGTGVAVMGCDYDGNGDFLALNDCDVLRNLYGVSWGHTQFRQLNVTNCRFNYTHTAFNANAVGRQNGRPMISATGSCFDTCYQIINANNVSWGGYCSLNSCYAELLYRVGDFYHGASAPAASLSIRDCYFNFSSLGGYTNTQKSIIDVRRTPLYISGGCMSLVNSVVPFIILGEPKHCEISTAITGAGWTAGNTVARAIAAGSTCHIMFLNTSQGPWKGTGFYSPAYNPNTGNEVTNDDRMRYGDHALSNVQRVIPFCASRASGSNGGGALPVMCALGQTRYTVAGASASSISQIGRVLTFTHTQTTTNVGHLLNWGMSKGSLFYHDASQNLYVIDSHASGVTTATQINNYNKTTGTPVVAPTATGTYWYIPAGHFTPNYAYEATYSTGSSTVTIVRADGGNAATTDIVAGCAKYTSDLFDAMSPIAQGNGYVSSVGSGPPVALTMGGVGRASRTEHVGLWYVNRP